MSSASSLGEVEAALPSLSELQLEALSQVASQAAQSPQAHSAQVPQVQAHSVPLQEQRSPPLSHIQLLFGILDPLGLVRPNHLEQGAPANGGSQLPEGSHSLQAS